MTQVAASAPPGIDLLPMTAAHLPAAHALSQVAGWPHRIEDWALTLSVSQGVVAVAQGRLVGTAICSVFGPVATLNMIIVDESMRGRGLGRLLMQRLITLAAGREIRLVATEDGLPLYRKLGFVACGRILQHQGLALAARPERPVRIGAADPATLAAMDTSASGMERAPLLTRIAATGETLRTEGGFALLRAFGRGHVLGPVVARDAAGARALISVAAERMAGRFLRIDLPEDPALARHAETLGLTPAGGGTAMVQAPRPRPHSDYHTHALVSQALG